MARVCQICGKSPATGQKRKLLRGHYNPTKKAKRAPNLQWVRLANGKRIRACARCIKTLSKIRV